MIKGDTGIGVDKKLWMCIWKAKGLAPKLKLFIWRCVRNAIPVRGVIGARIRMVPVVCQLCRREPESIEHALFGCDFARAAWWCSPLNLRSDALQGSFRQILEMVSSSLTETDVIRFVCMAWDIWRVRNDVVMGGKQVDMQTCSTYYNQTLLLCQISNCPQPVPVRTVDNSEQQQTEESGNSILVCYVDGSWSPDGQAGVGANLNIEGKTVTWISKSVLAMNAAHAEAIAVLIGYQLLQTQLKDAIEERYSLIQRKQWTHLLTNSL